MSSLVLQWQPLASQLAARWWLRHRYLDKEDVMQAAYLGLAVAAKRHDPESGYSFSTLATIWVRKYVRLLCLAESNGGVKVGEQRGFSQVGHSSLDDTAELFEAPPQPLPSVEVDDFWAKVRRTLGPRHLIVIRRKYLDGLSLVEIGRELGASKQRVNQIENEALDRLRKVMSEAWEDMS